MFTMIATIAAARAISAAASDAAGVTSARWSRVITIPLTAAGREARGFFVFTVPARRLYVGERGSCRPPSGPEQGDRDILQI